MILYEEKELGHVVDTFLERERSLKPILIRLLVLNEPEGMWKDRI